MASLIRAVVGVRGDGDGYDGGGEHRDRRRDHVCGAEFSLSARGLRGGGRILEDRKGAIRGRYAAASVGGEGDELEGAVCDRSGDVRCNVSP